MLLILIKTCVTHEHLIDLEILSYRSLEKGLTHPFLKSFLK